MILFSMIQRSLSRGMVNHATLTAKRGSIFSIIKDDKSKQVLNQSHMIVCMSCQKHFLHLSSQYFVEEKKKNEFRGPSLIVQNILRSQQSTEPREEVSHSENYTENLSQRLSQLCNEVDTLNKDDEWGDFASKINKEGSVTEGQDLKPSKLFTNDYSEDFLEDVVFQADIHHQPKPSPLLGTEDQNVPESGIPCVGCGAHLQCKHRTVPGFMPSEQFKILSDSELKTSICQRCYYIEHCDAFVEVTSDPEDYAKIISEIRPTRSVVVIVIDVTDIEGSLIPNLAQYIGHKHPLIVVGNKVDLIAPDSTDYLVRIREAITKSCHNAGLRNLRKVTLISAKTGFGVERLINTLFSLYKNKADVFIVGTANAGKSSLFNTLLASDYCRQKARSLIQRATVSVWPGTTLNLLKFPIMRPTPRTLALRHRRLKQEEAMRKDALKQEKQRTRQKQKQEQWQLKESVTMTDMRTSAQIEKDEAGQAWGQEVFAYKGSDDGFVSAPPVSSKEPFDDSQYPHTYWVYDSPGVINPDQIFNLLNPDEVPRFQLHTPIRPRCLVMKPGSAIFVSGLARLDYVEGCRDMMVTVHCGPNLPIRVVSLGEADQFFLNSATSKQLEFPVGDQSRWDRVPSLVAKGFEIEGEDDTTAVADIQLSSIGWVSLAPRAGCSAKLRAYTPGRKGIHLRCPPLIPKFSPFKGKRLTGTPFFRLRDVSKYFHGKELLSSENDV